MRVTLRILAFAALVGGAFWIWHSPREVEPYVTSVTLLAGFLATFVRSKDASPLQHDPDVIAYLAGGHLQHHLVIENRGTASAYDVELQLHLADGQTDPLVQGAIAETFPIKELYGQDQRQILAALTYGTGTEFEATWTWKSAKGRKFKRRNTIALRR